MTLTARDKITVDLVRETMRQAEIGHTVMVRCGHSASPWLLSDLAGPVATLTCEACDAVAQLYLVCVSGGTRFVTLLLPDGDCPQRNGRGIDERPCRWSDQLASDTYLNDAPDGD